MLRVTGPICRFARDERGATSIEYGMIALLVAVGMLVALRSLGETNANSWNRLGQQAQRRHAGQVAVSGGAAAAGLAVSPAGCSVVPSASASRALAVPGRSGCCWLSCGAQAVSVTISKVAGTRPSGRPKRSW